MSTTHWKFTPDSGTVACGADPHQAGYYTLGNEEFFWSAADRCVRCVDGIKRKNLIEARKDRLYLLILTGGVEVYLDGPFLAEDERLDAAKKFWQGEARSDDGDNIFQLTIDENGELSVASYLAGDLDAEEAEDNSGGTR